VRHRKNPPRLQAKRPTTFAEIRFNAEERLRHGLKLDFDQIMLDIGAIRAAAEKPTKN
jgi:hypothetical protein